MLKYGSRTYQHLLTEPNLRNIIIEDTKAM